MTDNDNEPMDTHLNLMKFILKKSLSILILQDKTPIKFTINKGKKPKH